MEGSSSWRYHRRHCAGCVWGACIGNALTWLPDRRGLAAGLTAAGFGAGAALTVLPPAPRRQAPRDCPPADLLRAPLFWLLYGLFAAVAAGGLTATAQPGPIAQDYQPGGARINLPGLVLPTLPLALSLNNIVNGLTRPLSGWLGDRPGRENTMLLRFSQEGFALLSLVRGGRAPALFAVSSALVFFAWGEVFSIFPATVADPFGAAYAAANCGLLYTAKGTAAFMAPLASLVIQQGGNWTTVLAGAAAINLVAGLAAKRVLQPLRRRQLEKPR